MKSKNTNMQLIFDELSEKNQDLMILLARSIVYAQNEVQTMRDKNTLRSSKVTSNHASERR